MFTRQLIIGAPDWIRTSGPQIRNLMLYPTELRVQLELLFTLTPRRGVVNFL